MRENEINVCHGYNLNTDQMLRFGEENKLELGIQ
jgi:hypothetical protein